MSGYVETTDVTSSTFKWNDKQVALVDDVTTALVPYITSVGLTTTLADFVTNAALSTSLGNYYNKGQIDSSLALKQNLISVSSPLTLGIDGKSISIDLSNYSQSLHSTRNRKLTRY